MKVYELDMSMEKLNELAHTKSDEFLIWISQFSTRRYYIGDIGINRRTLNHWEKENLLPYSYKQTGWRKFSFYEFIWLRSIQKYRDIGLGLDKIRMIKDELFTMDEDFLLDQIKAHAAQNRDQPTYKNTAEIIIKSDELKPMLSAALEEQQVSLFSSLIQIILMERVRMSLVLDDTNKIYPISHNKPIKELEKENDGLIREMSNRSYIVLNLWQLVVDVISHKDLDREPLFYNYFLSDQEMKLIEKVRSGLFKEITVIFSEDRMTHFKLTKHKTNEDIAKAISRMLAKGEFKSIEIKCYDGKVMHIDETVSEKLE